MTSQAPVAAPRAPLLDLLDREFRTESLRRLLGNLAEQIPAKIWNQALRTPLEDVLGRRGKEFRARLVATSFGLAGGRPPLPPEVPALVELLHTGSLVIDDIEDDSESRRGAPSLHVAYGTPVALNAGNWIYFWAFHLVEHLPLDGSQQLSLLRHMSRALLACHFGQALDLSVAVDQVPKTQVELLVRAAAGLKTGRLMQLGAEVGAVAAGADEARRAALGDFGCRVGLGLQMLDDLGGLTSERRRHKGFEELRLGRLTPFRHPRPSFAQRPVALLLPASWFLSSRSAPKARGLARIATGRHDTGQDDVRPQTPTLTRTHPPHPQNPSLRADPLRPALGPVPYPSLLPYPPTRHVPAHAGGAGSASPHRRDPAQARTRSRSVAPSGQARRLIPSGAVDSRPEASVPKFDSTRTTFVPHRG